MTITVTASGISLDGPLVAGEVVAVSVSGVTFAEDSKPTLCLLGRFPDALLSSVELAEDENTPGTWTGQLDTATKQTAVFFATARADECRDAVLELVAARQSVARLMVAFRNSALCPSPFHAPDASPVYIPVPGPPGQGGDPYDQNPAMDGTASPGVSDEYARGDHTHPTDSSRAAQADVAAIQGVIPATASSTNKLVTAADLTGKANDADVVKLTGNQTIAGDKTFTGQVSAADVVTGFSYGFPGGNYISVPAKSGNALTDTEISDSTTSIGAALAAKADASSLATVATTGDYGDLLNKPTIPAAQVNADWNASSGVAQILNKPTIPDVSGKADSAAIAPAFSASSTYAVGDYVTHEGLLYKCTTAVSTAGAWDSSDWTAVAVMGEIPAPITVDSAMSSSSTNPVQNKVVNTAIDGKVSWGNSNKNAITVGSRATSYAVGENSLTVGAANEASGAQSFSQGQSNSAKGQSSFAEGQGGTAKGFASHTAGRRSITASGTGSTVGTAHDYAWAWQGTNSSSDNTPYYHSHGNGTFNVNPVPASGSTDPATGFWIGEKRLPEVIAQNTNYLPYASTTTLAPETAVYRATAALSGTTATMPAVAITGIPTAAAYFAFELEVAVDATATALDDTAWSGWTWMDGGELPTADYAGKTLYIACRLDCTARTIKANCYEVA
jgi:hypothetical protein